MRRLRALMVPALFLVTGVCVGETAFAQRGPQYEVTVTNLTRGQQFTPILVASHREGATLFSLGETASSQLETLAEEGNTGPLANLLLSMPEVKDVKTSPAPPPASNLIDPGESVVVTVEAGAGFGHLSVAAMLIPTNDGFFAINAVKGPKGNKTLTLLAPAYDAGSERNDELCASIPGPNFAECGGAGGGAMVVGGEEGYVHIHAGIHGIGDLVAANRDWRNPVAKVTIRRVR
jgi:hypothetical protein